LQSEGFERELTVRKYERDVELLEAVRREDERRAKEEAERRAREEAERRQKLEADRWRTIETTPPRVQGVPFPVPEPPKPTRPDQKQSGEVDPIVPLDSAPAKAADATTPLPSPSPVAAGLPSGGLPEPVPQAGLQPPPGPVPVDTARPASPPQKRAAKQPASRDVFGDLARSGN
jgi:hypothetical protein